MSTESYVQHNGTCEQAFPGDLISCSARLAPVPADILGLAMHGHANRRNKNVAVVASWCATETETSAFLPLLLVLVTKVQNKSSLGKPGDMFRLTNNILSVLETSGPHQNFHDKRLAPVGTLCSRMLYFVLNTVTWNHVMPSAFR